MTLVSQNNRRAAQVNIFIRVSVEVIKSPDTQTRPSPFSEVYDAPIFSERLQVTQIIILFFISKIHVFMMLLFRTTSSYPNYYFICQKIQNVLVFKMLLFKNLAHYANLEFGLVWLVYGV